MNDRPVAPTQSSARHRAVGITGGAGALARHLVPVLARRGVERIVLLDKRTPPLAFPQGSLPKGTSLIGFTGDILSPDDLRKGLQGCQFVFHLAAQTHLGRAHSQPMETLRVNVQGTANVLDTCRTIGAQGMLYTSTIHVYGAPQRLPLSEDHPTTPLSIYAASKLAGETIVQGYRTAFGMNNFIVRLSNVYGAGFSTDTVVGRALDQVRKGTPITLRSFTPIRDFIYAEDVAEALVALGLLEPSAAYPTVFNVSSGQGTSIGEMAHLLDQVAISMGLGGKGCTETGGDDPIPAMVADPSRLRNATGWSPKYDLRAGLEQSLRDLLNERDTP